MRYSNETHEVATDDFLRQETGSGIVNASTA